YLLRERIFEVDRFIQLADFLKNPQSLSAVDYRVVIENERPHFYLKKSTSSSLGKTFGRYEIIEEIARGGMGIVYKARHQNLNQFCALKVLLPGSELSPKLLDRFRREAIAMAKLRHPGIVQIFDSGFEGEQLYLAMELIRGKTLQEIIKIRFTQYPLRQKVQILLSVAEALHYAHTQGVIHRDLKPGNIFVDSQHQPKIGDFGLAQDTSFSSEEVSRLTVSGAILGTPAYMSPEQARGETKNLTPAADIYSLGVCFYEFVTGKVPFSGNFSQLLESLQNELPPRPNRYVKSLHPDVETMILACLEKDPAKRYQTGEELAQDMKAFLEGSPISRRPPSLLEKTLRQIKRHQREFLITSILFFFAFVYLGYTYFLRLQKYHYHQQLGDTALTENRFLDARVAYEQSLVYFSSHEIKKKLSTVEEKKDRKEREERNQKATVLIQQAEAILQKHKTLSKEEALPLLLKGFNLISEAILLLPEASALITQRNEMVQILIPIACNLKNYQLAIYVADQLKEQNDFHQGLLFYIEQAQNEELNFQKKRISFWRKKFDSDDIQQGDMKNAQYELSRMNHPAIREEMIALLEKAPAYFQSHTRAEGKTQFLMLLTELLGYSNQTSFAPQILKILESLVEFEWSLPPERRALDTFELMISLSNALGILADPSTEKRFATLRKKMGEESIFWIRTKFAYAQIPLEVDLTSTDIHYLLETGSDKIQKSHPSEEIIPIFKRVLELEPENSRAFLELGRVLMSIKKLEGKEYLQNALLLESENAFYQLEVGRVYYQYGEDEEQKAIDCFSRAIELNPELQHAYQRRGRTYSDLNQIEEALTDYNKALALNPQDIYTYVYRGIVAKKGFNLQDAISDFNKALVYFPEDDFIYYQRGTAYDLLGDERSAINDFSACIRLDPQGDYYSGSAYSYRGELRLKQGDYGGAIADFTQAMEMEPDANEYYTKRGDAYQAMGYPEEAQKSYEVALSIIQGKIKRNYPYHVKFFPRQGYIYLKLNNTEKAKESFDAYAKENPEEPMTYYHYTCFYALIQDETQSLQNLKKAIKIGLEHTSMLKTDADLNNIRNTKEFQKILQDLEKK
ncbi:MAG: protein kinase, partial [Planctomycetota bacterium]